MIQNSRSVIAFGFLAGLVLLVAGGCSSASRGPLPNQPTFNTPVVLSPGDGEFMAHPEIDGALVGGASLDPEEFALIVKYR